LIHEFVSLDVASKLLGLTPALVTKRARTGAYGPVLGGTGDERLRFISTRAIALVSGFPISQAQFDEAKAAPRGTLLAFSAPSDFERANLRRQAQTPLTIEQVAGEVIHTPHKEFHVGHIISEYVRINGLREPKQGEK
jgi:hypothetical protein